MGVHPHRRSATKAFIPQNVIRGPTGGTLRDCQHCFFAQYNLGLDSLQHLCRCACVQDAYDLEQFEQHRFEHDHFSKNRMVIRPEGEYLWHNR